MTVYVYMYIKNNCESETFFVISSRQQIQKPLCESERDLSAGAVLGYTGNR